MRRVPRLRFNRWTIKIKCFFKFLVLFYIRETKIDWNLSVYYSTELMNLTASRKKAEEVAADHTVRFIILSAVLVVEMLSALLQCYP